MVPFSDLALRPLLQRIGLDQREVEVYLAMLSLKSARATDIAKLAKQSRSHTYLMLRSLEQRGLVSEVERGKVLQFMAEPPERLIAYLKDREKELHELGQLAEGALPQLRSLTNPLIQAPRVTLLHGLEGMKQVYREIFPNSFCALFNTEAMYQAFGSGAPQMILKENQGLLGRDLLVDNRSAQRFIAENKQSEEYEIRLLPKDVIFGTDTMVYGDTMIILAYDADHTIIRIQNKNIADSFRAWFEVLWESAKKTKNE